MLAKILFWGSVIALFGFGAVMAFLHAYSGAGLTCLIGVGGGIAGLIQDLKRTKAQ